MNQIDRFATATGLALADRAPKTPFFVDYAIRVVGKDDDPKFELWRRPQNQEPVLVGEYDTFASAEGAADRHLGRKIPSRSWRESDEGDWALPAP